MHSSVLHNKLHWTVGFSGSCRMKSYAHSLSCARTAPLSERLRHRNTLNTRKNLMRWKGLLQLGLGIGAALLPLDSVMAHPASNTTVPQTINIEPANTPKAT